MSKIIFYGAISMDGYLATTNDDLQWLFDTPTGEKQPMMRFIKPSIQRSWAEKHIKKPKNI